MLNRYDNLVITRTFTKGYQFLSAGIKVGYGILPPELSAYYDKVDFPFPVSGAASSLAREALLDLEFVPSLRQRIKSIKDKLIKGLIKMDYLIAETFEDCPIFLLGHKNSNVNLKEYLLTKGILASSPSIFYESDHLGKNYVRIDTPVNAEDFLSRL